MPLTSETRLGTLRAWMCIAACAALPIADCAAWSAGAPSDTSTVFAEPHRTIVFSPDRADRCDYFFVTEFNVGVTGVKSQDGLDRFLFTDALGLMWNFDRTRAIGVSIDAHLTAGAINFAPTIRFKQWLAGRRSLDLSLGYASDSEEQEGTVGLIANVRYSPSEWFHVQAGACRIRDVGSIFYYPEYHVNETSEVEIYVGAGLGGVPGVVSWGAQAVGFAGLVLLFSGME